MDRPFNASSGHHFILQSNDSRQHSLGSFGRVQRIDTVLIYPSTASTVLSDVLTRHSTPDEQSETGFPYGF